MFSVVLDSEIRSKKLAINIARQLVKGSIVSLSGGLGTGKTFICREIIRYLLGSDVNVASPTFNLLLIYEAKNFTIYHFDLYRLKTIDEIYELAINDAFHSGLSLIEWPELIIDMLPHDAIKLKLEIKNNIRYCTIEGLNDILNNIKEF